MKGSISQTPHTQPGLFPMVVFLTTTLNFVSCLFVYCLCCLYHIKLFDMCIRSQQQIIFLVELPHSMRHQFILQKKKCKFLAQFTQYLKSTVNSFLLESSGYKSFLTAKHHCSINCCINQELRYVLCSTTFNGGDSPLPPSIFISNKNRNRCTLDSEVDWCHQICMTEENGNIMDHVMMLWWFPAVSWSLSP